MSGIYISGIEMPTSLGEYILRMYVYLDGTTTLEGAYCRYDGEPFDAVNAILVPPHGRLIDADALGQYMLNEHYNYRLVYDADEVANAPTVIPPEEKSDD